MPDGNKSKKLIFIFAILFLIHKSSILSKIKFNISLNFFSLTSEFIKGPGKDILKKVPIL